MNRKQFLLVLTALTIIGGASLALLKQNHASWSVREAKAGDSVLPNFRFNDVAAIHIKSRASDFHIVRKNGSWSVPERGDYPADYQHIKSLLLKVTELKIVRSETVGDSQLNRVELNEPTKENSTGTLVEFQDTRGTLIDSLLVGKRHLREQTESDPFRMRGLFDGCYVRRPKEPETVLLISDDLASVVAEPGAWVDGQFAKIENIKSMSLIASSANTLWSLTRETPSGKWISTTGKTATDLDTRTISQTAELLGLLSFVDIASPATSFQITKTLTVQTFDGLSYTLQIGDQRPDQRYEIKLSVTADAARERTSLSEQKMQEKLAHEQTFARWVYVIEPSMAEPLIRDTHVARAEIIPDGAVSTTR